MTPPKPDHHHPPPTQAAIIFLDPAPGDVSAQLARLARWAERNARRLATQPAPAVQSSHAQGRARAQGGER